MVVSEVERHSIAKALPLLKEIEDINIREGVIRVWARIWRESGYQTLEESPNGDDCEQDTLVKHTNAIASASLVTAQQLEEEYGIQVNRDVLLAAAILHDVDKLVLCEKNGDRVQSSEMGKRIPHGSYGGHIALVEGLPLDVANIIITHGRDSNWQPVTIEGSIIYYCDLCKYFAVRMAFGKRILPEPPLRG